MVEFNFFHPVEVRYADLDALRHVNNARYFTYMEQARASYLQALHLWDGRDMASLGVIVAQASCQYRRAIQYGDAVLVGVATVELGEKSIHMVYRLEGDEGTLFAEGRTTLVAYDYGAQKSIAIPEDWRRTLSFFEGLTAQ